jgi:hypothetical protein
LETPKWVWKRFIYGFIALVFFSFFWDGLSHEASEKCWELTIFVAVVLLVYIGLLPEPGDDKVEIFSPGEFLAPILFFAAPIMGTIAFFFARFIRTFLS